MEKVIVLALLLLSLPARAATEHVIVVSIDGGKPAAMKAAAMPNLMRIARDGASTWNARTVLPSATHAAHASMITGVDVDKHKIDYDDWDPKKGQLRVDTMFGVARAQGLKTAMIAAKPKFQTYDLPGTLDFSWIGRVRDGEEVINRAVDQLLTVRPNLMLVHLPDGDDAGHEFGWDTAQQKARFERIDSVHLPRLFEAISLAGIASTTLVLITADHGGHDREHGDDVLTDTVIPWIAFGAGVRPGLALPDGIRVFDTAATALRALGVAVPAKWKGKPVALQ